MTDKPELIGAREVRFGLRSALDQPFGRVVGKKYDRESDYSSYIDGTGWFMALISFPVHCVPLRVTFDVRVQAGAPGMLSIQLITSDNMPYGDPIYEDITTLHPTSHMGGGRKAIVMGHYAANYGLTEDQNYGLDFYRYVRFPSKVTTKGDKWSVYVKTYGTHDVDNYWIIDRFYTLAMVSLETKDEPRGQG